jgi:GNAT superfamily N-acetyltransferase
MSLRPLLQRKLRLLHIHNVLYRWNPQAPPPPLPARTDVVVTRATAAEAQSWPDYLDSWQTSAQVVASLRRGDQMFVARCAATGAFLGVRWARLHRISLVEFDYALPPGTTFLTGGYVVPEFRRRGISDFLFAHILHWAHAQRLRCGFTATTPANIASRCTYRRYAFEFIARVHVVRALALRVVRIADAHGRVAWTAQLTRAPSPRLTALLFTPWLDFSHPAAQRPPHPAQHSPQQ